MTPAMKAALDARWTKGRDAAAVPATSAIVEPEKPAVASTPILPVPVARIPTISVDQDTEDDRKPSAGSYPAQEKETK
jgi:hypothetical protein